jgi:hypothetical protein
MPIALIGISWRTSIHTHKFRDNGSTVGLYRFLPVPFQFIIQKHLSLRHYLNEAVEKVSLNKPEINPDLFRLVFPSAAEKGCDRLNFELLSNAQILFSPLFGIGVGDGIRKINL